MGQIGYLGEGSGSGLLFIVSREVFRSPTNMTWSGKARYATHERHMTHALTEFTGLDPDEFSFDLLLTAELGVTPMEEIEQIWDYEREGTPLGLVIGSHAYGKYRWTIQSHETKMEYTDVAGDLYAVEVSVSLLEYLRSESETGASTVNTTTTTGTGGSSAASGSTYTVKSGDCLWKIAANAYGDGSQWRKIYEANQSVIGSNPNLIYPGQVYTIPS